MFGLRLHKMEEEIKFFDDIVKLIKEHIFDQKFGKIRHNIGFKELNKEFELTTPSTPLSDELVINYFKKYLDLSVKTNQPGFLQSLWGGSHIPAILGELLVASTNTSMYTFDTAPVATVIEKSIISKLTDLIGWIEGDGTFTSGGSNGNLLGLVCARNYIFPEYVKKGNLGKEFQIYISSESHYSIENAVKIMGIGTENIIKINCDKNGKMKVQDLEKEIKNTLKKSKIPMCVVSTGGTTIRGNFDPINQISKICKKYDIWHHLDAAWGGAALFSKKSQHLLDGINEADSICWDPHKLMGLPLICSTFLVKNSSNLRMIASCEKDPEYLFHGEENNLDLGKTSLACGRRADVIKLWFTWLTLGTEGWTKRVEYCLDLASYLEKIVKQHQNLELMSSREFTNVCFRWIPEEINEIDEFNIKLRQKLVANGEYMISLAQLEGVQILRPVIAHPTITKSTLDGLIIEIESIAKNLSK